MEKGARFDEIFEHVASLRRYALGLTGTLQDAEDLVQECLLRAIQASDTWRPGSNLRAWLFRIMHNAHISAVRRRRLEENARSEFEARPRLANALQALPLEVEDVLRALAELPEAQRQVITLIAVEDLKYAEAAQRLDIPLGTLMSRLGRAREALRGALQHETRPHLRLLKGEQK